MKKTVCEKLTSLVLLIALAFFSFPVQAQKIKWSKVKILVYTKNGKGYVHDNIAKSV